MTVISGSLVSGAPCSALVVQGKLRDMVLKKIIRKLAGTSKPFWGDWPPWQGKQKIEDKERKLLQTYSGSGEGIGLKGKDVHALFL